MNYFDKHKILIWALVFFLVINITALVTFFIYFSGMEKPVSMSGTAPTCGQLCRMLDLTGEQAKDVEAIQTGFREKADPLIAEIRKNRRMMLEELSQDSPDTVLINQYSDSIGELHKQLQRTAAGQFLSLKKVCNPEQCRKMSEMYYDLYGCNGPDSRMKAGKGKQHRFHGGR